MQPLIRKSDDGATVYIEPNSATDSGVCDRCAGEGGTVADAATIDGIQLPGVLKATGALGRAGSNDTEQSDSATPAEVSAFVESLSGRRWYVCGDRLVGVDVTDASEGVPASAIPFTVDGRDIFQFEDVSKVRLELCGESTAVVLAGALAFLRARYQTLRPATTDEIPSAPCALHDERLVVRFSEWCAATTADAADLEALVS